MGNTGGQNNSEWLYYYQSNGMLKAEESFELICILEK